jgi:hypothetical protein
LAGLQQDMLMILDPAALCQYCGYDPMPDEVGRRVML